MTKLQMLNPIVEMDGDEMTRVLWQMIKAKLLLPYIDLKTEYYDLHLSNRDETDDRVTVEAAEAIKKWHVGVKCATITPNKQRVEEYGLKQMWKSPNGTIRAILDGTVFRAPIMVSCIKPVVKPWKKPITIARHAYGDIYKSTEYRVPGAGKAELLFRDAQGQELFRETVFDFTGPGVLQAQYNTEESILAFARSTLRYGLDTHQDVWFATKDTISKQYDQTFKLLVQRVFDEEFAEAYAQAGLTYFYTLIDDAVARVIRSAGGFVWACKNYDGDVMSDMVSTAFGSLAMMTSVLVSPDGNYEYEAAHGTVTRHWYRYRDTGEMPGTNPVATIFAWTGALNKRGEMDNTPELCAFAKKLEKATLDTIESGVMTGDLAAMAEGVSVQRVNSAEFIQAIADRL